MSVVGVQRVWVYARTLDVIFQEDDALHGHQR